MLNREAIPRQLLLGTWEPLVDAVPTEPEKTQSRVVLCPTTGRRALPCSAATGLPAPAGASLSCATTCFASNMGADGGGYTSFFYKWPSTVNGLLCFFVAGYLWGRRVLLIDQPRAISCVRLRDLAVRLDSVLGPAPFSR